MNSIKISEIIITMTVLLFAMRNVGRIAKVLIDLEIREQQ